MAYSKRSPRPRLGLEELEQRECPSLSPWTTDTFDGSKVGALPTDWSGYSGDQGKTAFLVTQAPTSAPAWSGANELTVAPPAGTSTGAAARAWWNAFFPPDVQVTAAVRLNPSSSGQLLARGTNLDTSSPSFYALSATTNSTGTTFSLERTVPGTTTELVTLNLAGTSFS